ncbi:family 43 glycosylhydrolase [uncultured Polaribacter sp.]|uniref:family 43 glycosylhydrolase n=1 Tax=uncultured Polaribacter sp. TaxID=174711 RepID=UPI00262F5FE5|nr:family 43 glycosylhydrolase [uncultured Polaribacter sp.]
MNGKLLDSNKTIPFIHFLNGIIVFSILFFTPKIGYSQNPISPPGFYFVDPSAKVFNDGKLYVYGSTDENPNYYCSGSHDILYTENMIDWNISKNVFASKGVNDQVPYNDAVLFAPDAIKVADTYYLYYCQPYLQAPEGVATSKNPLGPFINGEKIDLKGHNQIDPSVFIDDDGAAYYLWGQFNLKMAKLNAGMKTIDARTLQKNIITEKNHYFHEGAYLTKRQGIYYLVYSDISREDKPTSIGYATSTSPFGPYTYRGVIIDNNGANPNSWNNHGSIIEYKNQWYVFYHRSTHGVRTMRKACVEKIIFLEDGSISEVEMTSQGAGPPLKATTKIDAAVACLLHGNVRIKKESDINEILSEFKNKDAAIYKYLDFGDGVSTLKIRVKSILGGKLNVYSDKPWNKKLATLKVQANKDWQTIIVPVKNETGIHALWLEASGSDGELFEIDWFQFD